MNAKHRRKAGSRAQNASREPVVKRSRPTQPISPFSATFAAVAVNLPVWGRAAVYLERFPDPILKVLKRQVVISPSRASNDRSGKSLRLYNRANFEGHEAMSTETRAGASVAPVRM